MIDIVEELSQNFINSSYETNTNRAFPHIADGLKPSQRACLWEMYRSGYTSNKPHVKSAKISGSVVALWHPHSQDAIYETFVRMAQPFTTNAPEVGFHGAYGNIILGGDAFAAARYSEARLSPIAEDGLLYGINKQNVPMKLNFSEDEYWPEYLPALFPRLLVNGAQGIGTGMANYWLPHNLGETVELILHYLNTNELKAEQYYPDFPSGGTIINQEELGVINATGKGSVVVEAKYYIKKDEIIFYEFPYQVYIEPVIEKIQNIVDSGGLGNVRSVLNKSDKTQIALVVECRKGTAETVVEELLQSTPLRSSYSANQNAIVSKTPTLLNLQQTVNQYVDYNIKSIVAEMEYDIEKLSKRIEVLEGLNKALENIDTVVAIIRHSSSTQEAKEQLLAEGYTETQVAAIMDMQLSRLARMEKEKIEKELKEKSKTLKWCQGIVNSPVKQKNLLAKRLAEFGEKHSTPRKTEVTQKTKKVLKPSVQVKDIVVQYDERGYLSAVLAEKYEGKGEAIAMRTDENVLLYTSKGKCYRIFAEDIGINAPNEKGTAIAPILKLEEDEAILKVTCGSHKQALLVVSASGFVKRLRNQELDGNVRNLSGMSYTKEKEILLVCECDGNDYITLKTEQYQICFRAVEVSFQGKAARGVVGMRHEDTLVFAGVTKTPPFTPQRRGGKGQKNVN